MRRRPSNFVTWGVVAFYLGIPLAACGIVAAFLVWVYGFR